jgi:hypothetical protein
VSPQVQEATLLAVTWSATTAAITRAGTMNLHRTSVSDSPNVARLLVFFGEPSRGRDPPLRRGRLRTPKPDQLTDAHKTRTRSRPTAADEVLPQRS